MSGTETVIIITAVATLIAAIFTGLAHVRIKSACCSIEPHNTRNDDELSKYSHDSDT